MPATGELAGPPLESDFAERTLIGWHVLFAAMVVVCLVVMVGGGHAALGAALLTVLAAAYLLLALPASRCGDTRRAALYLAIAYGVLFVLEWHDPAALVLLFVLYPQGFVLLPRREAIVATIVLSVGFSLVLVALDGWTGESWAWHGLGGVANIVFALVIGLFIDGLVRESRRRKELVQELLATRAELASAEREAGGLAERERLARDIHDTLAQGFTSIVMLAQAGETASARGDDATATRRFSEIQATARDNLAEARALVGALSPPGLGDSGLVGALRRLTDRHGAETGTPVSFTVTGNARPLEQSSEVAALRATQEALSNARRHAGAQHLDVLLCYDEDGATVTVTDDGRGFDVTAPRTGYGLDGLTSRVEQVGGLAQVDSAPGTGTRVKVRVP
jgi:signal transduction histidine kinase